MSNQGLFKHEVNQVRAAILPLLETVKDLKQSPLLKELLPPGEEVDKGEAIANIMLAYRHLEDARMRLGKAIQATEGGVSVYDKENL